MTTLKLTPAATLAELAAAATSGLAALLAAFATAQAQARTAALIDGLSEAERQDMGLPAAAAPGPVLTVERGLMARLESMR